MRAFHLLLNQFLLMASSHEHFPRYLFYLEIHKLFHIITLFGKHYRSLITIFLLRRTWTSYLLKLKQLKGDMVRLKQLVCLESEDCQVHLCILAVWGTESEKFCLSLEPQVWAFKWKWRGLMSGFSPIADEWASWSYLLVQAILLEAFNSFVFSHPNFGGWNSASGNWTAFDYYF